MPQRPTFPVTDAEHEAEAAQQLQIEADVAPAVEPDPAPAVEEVPTATIKSVDVAEYPIHVGVAQGEYTFPDADTTFDVPLEVAEQFVYVPQVEVVA